MVISKHSNVDIWECLPSMIICNNHDFRNSWRLLLATKLAYNQTGIHIQQFTYEPRNTIWQCRTESHKHTRMGWMKFNWLAICITTYAANSLFFSCVFVLSQAVHFCLLTSKPVLMSCIHSLYTYILAEYWWIGKYSELSLRSLYKFNIHIEKIYENTKVIKKQYSQIQ